MNAQDLYRAGKLADAVAAQNEEVRSHPADIERRSFLSELLCLSGNLERADAQLETIQKMAPGAGPALGLMRQLIRAEKTRHEVQLEGRPPEFLTQPGEHVQLYVQASAAFRAGDVDEAARFVEQAEEARPHVGGKCGAQSFDDFRDLDDMTGGMFEVLTSTGRYFWVPFESVASIEFDPPAHPLDLLWRPCAMSVREGPDGKVFLPAVYVVRAQDAAEVDDSARLGRRTDWLEASESGPVRGVGQRTFLVGEEARGMFELEDLEFEAPSA